jgi:hypothetical protein
MLTEKEQELYESIGEWSPELIEAVEARLRAMRLMRALDRWPKGPGDDPRVKGPGWDPENPPMQPGCGPFAIGGPNPLRDFGIVGVGHAYMASNTMSRRDWAKQLWMEGPDTKDQKSLPMTAVWSRLDNGYVAEPDYLAWAENSGRMQVVRRLPGHDHSHVLVDERTGSDIINENTNNITVKSAAFGTVVVSSPTGNEKQPAVQPTRAERRAASRSKYKNKK